MLVETEERLNNKYIPDDNLEKMLNQNVFPL
jgi:hypothetical protein